LPGLAVPTGCTKIPVATASASKAAPWESAENLIIVAARKNRFEDKRGFVQNFPRGFGEQHIGGLDLGGQSF